MFFAVTFSISHFHTTPNHTNIKGEDFMKFLKTLLSITIFSFMLSLVMTPLSTYAHTLPQEKVHASSLNEKKMDIANVQEFKTSAKAKSPSHPICQHGNIGCNSGTTMYYMGRITYGYDSYYDCICEIVWYRCSLCGYEKPVPFPT